MKIKKEILQAFCADDELRPGLSTPFLNKPTNEVWATNGRILLMVDPKLLRSKYKPSERPLTLTIPLPNSDTIVQLSDIDAAYSQFELIPEKTEKEGDVIECPACEGSGEVTWEYNDPDGHTHHMDADCPVCNGFGKLKKLLEVPTGRMLPPDDAGFVIDGAHFLARVLMPAIETLRKLGCKQLHHIVTSPNSPNLFHVQEGIRLLVMPCAGYEDMKEVKTVAVTNGDENSVTN